MTIYKKHYILLNPVINCNLTACADRIPIFCTLWWSFQNLITRLYRFEFSSLQAKDNIKSSFSTNQFNQIYREECLNRQNKLQFNRFGIIYLSFCQIFRQTVWCNTELTKFFTSFIDIVKFTIVTGCVEN